MPFVVGDGLESTVDAYSQLLPAAIIGKVIRASRRVEARQIGAPRLRGYAYL